MLGLSHGDRVRSRLRGLYGRFGAARTVPRSVPWAVVLAGASTAAAAVAAGA